MNTTVDEIADGIYRISTFSGVLTMNQFLVDGEQALLFHTGLRHQFAEVREAVERIGALDRLAWIAFGHVEADECGSLNEWLAAAPRAQVAHGSLGVLVQLADLADRAPRRLEDGDIIDTGSHRLRYVPTPHVPHGWDAGVLFDETTGTLLCGDLFTQYGEAPAVAGDGILEAACAAEDFGMPTALTPQTAPTLERLAGLEPTALAIMHGSAFVGPSAPLLRGLAGFYGQRLQAALGD